MVDRTGELKAKIEAKRAALKSELAEIKADAHEEKNDLLESIESKLGALGDLLKDGWDDLSEATAKKLSEWLD